MPNDPYAILGVASTATEQEIRDAYRQRARQYQPDGADSDSAAYYKTKMDELNAAYDAAILALRQKGGNAANPQFARVRSLIDGGDYSAADAALEEFPSSQRGAEWNYLKGCVFDKRGWMEQAANYYQKAAQAAPDNAEYRAAAQKVNWNRQGNYGEPPSGSSPQQGPYRSTGTGGCGGGCSGCDLCTGLCCADTCCECMGGDLCTCC